MQLCVQFATEFTVSTDASADVVMRRVYGAVLVAVLVVR